MTSSAPEAPPVVDVDVHTESTSDTLRLNPSQGEGSRSGQADADSAPDADTAPDTDADTDADSDAAPDADADTDAAPAPAPDAAAVPAADADAAPAPDPAHEEPLADLPLSARVEALVFASDRQITEGKLADVLGLVGNGRTKRVRAAIDELNASYEETGRAFRIERLAGGYQVLTQSSFGPLLGRLFTQRQHARLSPAALETLAITAYRQPVLRAELEAIRGVACGEVMRGLMERRLVKIVGRAEELGRPMLYGTTSEFLKAFGLASLDDLPEVAGLERRKETRTAAPKRADEPESAASAPADDTIAPDDAAPEAADADAPDAGPEPTSSD